MRTILIAIVALVSTAAIASAQPVAPAPAAAMAQAFTTTRTPIREILANPEAKAVLDAHLPMVSQSTHMAMIGGMTLKQLQRFAPNRVTDEILAVVDSEFVRLAPQR